MSTTPTACISPRQLDVLTCIQESIQRGSIPTYREIGAELGISSTNGVADHVKALIKKGYLTKSISTGQGPSSRNLRLTDSGADGGRRTAVVPVSGIPGHNYVRLDKSLLPKKTRMICLPTARVGGSAPRVHGDLVVIAQQSAPRPGEISVYLSELESQPRRPGEGFTFLPDGAYYGSVVLSFTKH